MRQSSSLTLHAASAQEMHALGSALGNALRCTLPRAGALVVGFEGELGAGKTTLVQGVLNALGVTGVIRSPTYTLIEAYEAAGRRLYHLDLYRLAGADEVEALGLRDLLEDTAVLLIEWPARGAGFLPSADLEIGIEYPDEYPGDGERRDDKSGLGSGCAADGSVKDGPATKGRGMLGFDGNGRVLTLRAGSSAGTQLIERLLAATSQ